MNHWSKLKYVTTKRCKYNGIFCRDSLKELETQLDFQNNFIG